MFANDLPGRSSFIHELDFRSKLLLLFIVMMICLLWNDPFLQLGLFLTVLMISWLSRISARYLGVVLGVMAPFAVMLVIVHGFFNVVQVQRMLGGAELTWLVRFPQEFFLIGGKGLTVEGTLYGVNVGLKSITLLLALPIVVLTTDVDQMLAGLVQMKIPYVLAFIFSSTLRFFPLLFAEAQSIIDAQRLRGLELERMNLFRRAEVYARTAVPLILSSLVKSQQLEIALHSKAFSVSPNRTSLHKIKLQRNDYLVCILGVFILGIILILYGWLGVGKFYGLT